MRDDSRAAALLNWALQLESDIEPGVVIPDGATLRPVSDDASFRRYFRMSEGAPGLIFVDAPPEHEDTASFVRISEALIEGGLNCPRVLAHDLDLGFMVITDLGDRVYLAETGRDPSLIEPLYRDAVDAITRMIPVACELPAYDEARLRTEMALFHEWFLPRQMGMSVSADVMSMLEEVYSLLVRRALEQPTGFVHRDFHSRNLMVTTHNNPGVLDFQDAVMGPVTYDLVSLYKDCYYRFDRGAVERAVNDFAMKLKNDGLTGADAPLLEWFDLMGAQRHLKCAGIFSRLHLRDGKPGYLKDIPLVIDYLLEVADLYPALEPLGAWLRVEVVPHMPARLLPGIGS